MDDGKGERDGHSRVDGVAALAQNVEPGFGGDLIRARDHGLRRALGLADHGPRSFEFETALGDFLCRQEYRDSKE